MAKANAIHRRLVILLLIIPVGMFAFAVGVLPPLYDVLCKITGLNGKTSNEAASLEGVVSQPERTVTIEFLAAADNGMPWEFKPLVYSIKAHPGEVHKVDFRVRNNTAGTLIGQAVPSVSPLHATAHFKKTQCFCFDQQELKGNAEKDMPVIFYVDPELPKDINTITLSYTLYNVTERVSANKTNNLPTNNLSTNN